MSLDHSQAPVLEALARYHASQQLSFSPPGHNRPGEPTRGSATFWATPSSMETWLPVASTTGADRHLAHPPSADDFEAAFAAHPDAKGALVTSPTPYGTCADLRALAASELRPAPTVDVPPPATLRLPQTCLPRDAFFGPVEDVPAQDAVGRVAAEMITPYPPGIPTVLPGELLTEPVLRYLRSGIEAGMNLPDAVDTQLNTVRVVAADKG